MEIVYSGATASPDPEQVQGLATMRRLKTAGELMQFLQAINWMQSAFPELAVVMQPLRDMLEEILKNKRRTRSVADKVEINREA